MPRVLKYIRQYYRPAPHAVLTEPSTYQVDGSTLPGLIHRPAGAQDRLPAWVVLHGLTFRGVNHPALSRFAKALAAAGHVVFIPIIDEWTKLLVRPRLTAPAIRGALETVTARDDVDPARVGLFGFSFGATQGLIAATHEDIAAQLKMVVAWGGYADLERLVQFGLTGDHELDGVHEHIDPDPYGRWMFGGNFLTSIPGYEHMGSVADALLELARSAGRSGTFAGDPMHEPTKRRLAEPLTAAERTVYELFAPIDTHDLAAARVLAARLAEAIRRREPLMDALPHLPNVKAPVMITHGHADVLVPFTEAARTRRLLPGHLVKSFTVTRLFEHSGGGSPFMHPVKLVRETGRFLSTLGKILNAL